MTFAVCQLQFSKRYIKARRHTIFHSDSQKNSSERERVVRADRRVISGYVKVTTSQYAFDNLGQGASVCERFKNPLQGSSMQPQDILFSHSAYNSNTTVLLLLGCYLVDTHCICTAVQINPYVHTHTSTIPGTNCHYPTSQIKSNLPVSARCLFLLLFPSRLSFSLTQL